MLLVVEYHGGHNTHRTPPSIVIWLVGFHESWTKTSVASDRQAVKLRCPSSA